MLMEGKPVIADPYFDVLLSDVKNERREGEEEGVVTLGEIAADMGFENRCEVDGAAAAIQSPLNGVVRGRCSRCFVPCVIKFRSKIIKTTFLIDTGGATCTYLGKPTWDKLLEGLKDDGVGGKNTLRVTLNGETRQEVTLSPQDRHFADIDVIGTDFFNRMEARIRVDYKTKACALEWDEPY